MSSRTHFQRALTVATVTAFVAAMVLAPQGSYALDAELTNEDTGADSDNVNDVDANRSISFTFTNTGSVDNDFDYDLNTGGNTVADNTTVGDIETGDITVEQEVENVVNQPVDLAGLEDALTSAGFDDASVEIINRNTGAGSTNTNDVTIDSTHDVTVTNTATATNTFALAVNTGDNDITDNTTVGDIRTGDIKVTGKVTNILNAERPTMPTLAPQGGGGLGQQGGPVTVAALPAAASAAVAPLLAVASVPAPAQVEAAAPEAAKAMVSPKAEFFPAGAAPTIFQYLALFLLAYLIVYSKELLTLLRRNQGALYRLSTALPLL